MMDEHEHLEEVGKVFGVTRERIRQIEAKALTKITTSKPKQTIKRFFRINDSRTKSSVFFF